MASEADGGKWRELVAEADKKAAEASSFVWHLSETDRQKWFNVYQRAKYLAGVFKDPTSKPTEKFNTQAILLGKDIENLEAAGKAVFNEARELERMAA